MSGTVRTERWPQSARQHAVGTGRGPRLCALPRRVRLGSGGLPAVHRADRLHVADRSTPATGCWRSASTASDVRRGDVVVFKDEPGAACRWSSGSSASAATRSPAATQGQADRQRQADRGTVSAPTGQPRRRPTDFPSTTVPKGRLFLLGDERTGSLDSRVHLQDADSGTVPRSAVTARVDAVAWPLDGGMLERPDGLRGAAGRRVPAGTAAADGRRGGGRRRAVLGGAAYGPMARLLGRRSCRRCRGAREDGAGARGGRRAMPDARMADGRSASCERSPGWFCSTREDRILLLHGYEPDDPADDLVVHPGRRPGGRREPGGGRAAGARGGDRHHRGRTRARCCGGGSAPSRSTGAAGTRTSGTSWPVPTQTETGAGGPDGAGAAQRRRSCAGGPAEELTAGT